MPRVERDVAIRRIVEATARTRNHRPYRVARRRTRPLSDLSACSVAIVERGDGSGTAWASVQVARFHDEHITCSIAAGIAASVTAGARIAGARIAAGRIAADAATRVATGCIAASITTGARIAAIRCMTMLLL